MTLALNPLPALHSPLGRLDPRWRLAALTLAAAATTLLQTLSATTVLCAGALLLALVARLPWPWYRERLTAVAPLLALFAVWLPFLVHGPGPVWDVGPLQVSWHGLRLALLLWLKGLAILTVMLVVLATAPLPVTLEAAYALRVPGLLVHLTLLTYRYIFLISTELDRLRVALRVRGYKNRLALHSYRTIGHVAGTLLVRSYERAERVGQAMRCRAFDGRFHSLAEFRTTPADLAAFGLIFSSTLAVVAWDFVQRGKAL